MLHGHYVLFHRLNDRSTPLRAGTQKQAVACVQTFKNADV